MRRIAGREQRGGRAGKCKNRSAGLAVRGQVQSERKITHMISNTGRLIYDAHVSDIARRGVRRDAIYSGVGASAHMGEWIHSLGNGVKNVVTFRVRRTMSMVVVELNGVEWNGTTCHVDPLFPIPFLDGKAHGYMYVLEPSILCADDTRYCC